MVDLLPINVTDPGVISILFQGVVDLIPMSNVFPGGVFEWMLCNCASECFLSRMHRDGFSFYSVYTSLL